MRPRRSRPGQGGEDAILLVRARAGSPRRRTVEGLVRGTGGQGRPRGRPPRGGAVPARDVLQAPLSRGKRGVRPCRRTQRVGKHRGPPFEPVRVGVTHRGQGHPTKAQRSYVDGHGPLPDSPGRLRTTGQGHPGANWHRVPGMAGAPQTFSDAPRRNLFHSAYKKCPAGGRLPRGNRCRAISPCRWRGRHLGRGCVDAPLSSWGPEGLTADVGAGAGARARAVFDAAHASPARC